MGRGKGQNLRCRPCSGYASYYRAVIMLVLLCLLYEVLSLSCTAVLTEKAFTAYDQ